jgi:pantoate--beta-alanine ligase
MNIFDNLDEWRAFRRANHDWQVGFVPTMGGLHAGHGALIERCVAENPQTIVSLFLNPTQFDQAGDLDSYPAERQRDLAQLESWGVDHVLAPEAAAMYPDGYRFRVTENELSTRFCGAHRPGHFDGVLTVVLKLLNLVQARRAYFGEKDWQQLRLVQDMARTLFLDTQIIACPVIRDRDGLALSTRNRRLSPAERKLAPELHRQLVAQRRAEDAAQVLAEMGFDVDYVEDHAGRRLAAARLGDTRLIDNVPLEQINEP